MRLILLTTVRLALAITTIAVGSGCPQDREVELTRSAVPLGVAAVGVGRAITIARPLDARPDQKAIGALFDEWGNTERVARPTNDPAVWIADAFVSGLENAGYRVYRSETAEQTVTPVVLVITVNEAYTKFSGKGWSVLGVSYYSAFSTDARIAVQVEALRSGSRILRRSYSGISSKDYPLSGGGPSADQYQQSLQAAMQSMLEKAIPNLASALAEKGA